METKHLDKEIERLEDMYKRTDLSKYGEGILAEYKAIKKALNIDRVIDCNPPFWMCKNTIVIARKLWENDEGDGIRKMKAANWLESTAKEYGYPISHYHAILLHEKYCR